MCDSPNDKSNWWNKSREKAQAVPLISRPDRGEKKIKPYFMKLSLIRNIGMWRSWLRHWATSRKIVGSIPHGVIGIFHVNNPAGRSIALESTQSLTEVSTRAIFSTGIAVLYLYRRMGGWMISGKGFGRKCVCVTYWTYNPVKFPEGVRKVRQPTFELATSWIQLEAIRLD
jgi:hypothetical protein